MLFYINKLKRKKWCKSVPNFRDDVPQQVQFHKSSLWTISAFNSRGNRWKASVRMVRSKLQITVSPQQRYDINHWVTWILCVITFGDSVQLPFNNIFLHRKRQWKRTVTVLHCGKWTTNFTTRTLYWLTNILSLPCIATPVPMSYIVLALRELEFQCICLSTIDLFVRSKLPFPLPTWSIGRGRR